MKPFHLGKGLYLDMEPTLLTNGIWDYLKIQTSLSAIGNLNRYIKSEIIVHYSVYAAL